MADSPPAEGRDCLRLHREGGKDAFQGTPTVERIARKPREEGRRASAGVGVSNKKKKGWQRVLPIFPGVGVLFLPGISCPACWPAYAGLLSALGVGFFNYSAYLLPVTILFMVLAVGSLGYHAGERRGYTPFIMGGSGAALMIIGKFLIVASTVTYGGVALLIAASVWNSWPRKSSDGAFCPACGISGKDTLDRRGDDNQKEQEVHDERETQS